MDTVGTAMVMVGMAMDTVVGTPDTVITRITDMVAIIQGTDMVAINQGIPLQVADMYRLTSTGPLTPTDPPKSRDRLHLALDRFKILPGPVRIRILLGPDRIRRTGLGKAPINDSARRLRSVRKT